MALRFPTPPGDAMRTKREEQWHIDGMNKNWHSAPPRGSTLRVPADLLGGCSRVLWRGVGGVAAQ